MAEMSPPSILSTGDRFVVVTPRQCLNRPGVWRGGGNYLTLAPRKPVPSWNTHRDLGACFALSSFSIALDRSKTCFYYTQSLVRRNIVVCSKLKKNGNGERHTESREAPKRNNYNKRIPFQLDSRFSVLLSSLRNFSFQDFVQKVGLHLQNNMKKAIVPSLIAFFLGLCFLFLRLSSVPSPKEIPYSDFIGTLQEGTVSKVLFEEGSRRILFNRVSDDGTEPASEPKMLPEDTQTDLAKVSINKKDKFMPQWMYSTRKFENDEAFLLSLLREKGIMFSSGPESALMSIRKIMVTILSLWIPLTPLMWLLHRQLSSTNSPAKKRRPTNQMISFGDVEGVDAAKEELMEIVSCLQGSINYSKLGAKLPRGVLLVGPPGTGKTLLARAVAGEAGVPFFSVSASEFVELFVGRGAARIRDLFSVARKCAPSIVFIDELDAVGGRRGRSFNDERDQTLNQLLTEMDGFESDMKVVVIAATNRPEALDLALCRPGRFSRRVLVGEPDFDGRKKILSVHVRGIRLDEDPEIICNLVATLTPGFTGADLANIANEAALLAARRGSENVSREDIMMAIERAKFGINEHSSISKKLGKLFPWMPSIARTTVTKENGLQGLTGYQTLS